MTRWQWLIVLVTLTVNLAGCGGMQTRKPDVRVSPPVQDELPPGEPGW